MGFPLFSEVSVQTAGQEIFFSSSFCWLLKQEKNFHSYDKLRNSASDREGG